MDITALLENEAFKDISIEQAALFREFTAKLEGKSGMEALPVIMEYSKKMKQFKKLSKEEETAMLAAFFDALPEKDRGAFKNIVKFMEG